MSFISNALGGLLGMVSGGDHAGARAADGYNRARDENNRGYDAALKAQMDATGSPTARQFGAFENAALQPEFDKQNQHLAARLSSMGIGSSGAGTHDSAQLQGDQSATLARAIAPLYQQAMSAYSGLLGAKYGGNSRLASEGAGAGNSAYSHAIDQFMSAAESAGTGMPSGGGGGGGGGGAAANPYAAAVPPSYVQNFAGY
ncbi:MAG: hypothetical protein NVS1B2_15740 [Vulcanimicrobiaceae bacterium]